MKIILAAGSQFKWNARTYELTTDTSQKFCVGRLVRLPSDAYPPPGRAEKVGQERKFWSSAVNAIYHT